MFCVHLRIRGRRGNKITGQKQTDTQIHKRRHPKKIVPNRSFVYLCICIWAKEITALFDKGKIGEIYTPWGVSHSFITPRY